MKTISVEELKSLLLDQKGTTFVSIETETNPRLKGGKSCPYFGVIKRSKVNGAIGFNYENSVNLQRAREGQVEKFFSENRTWGQRIKGTAVVEYKGKFYLELKVEKVYPPDFFLQGKRIENKSISSFLPEKKSSRQDVENEIVLRDYAFSSIKRIKIKNQEFSVL